MIYEVAERFKSIQGEGVYTGTPMAFIRFVGCSVGKKICHACDTDFEKILPWRGGGEYTEADLYEWIKPYHHICLTGGEPLDQDLEPLFTLLRLYAWVGIVHIETSGTRLLPDWLSKRREPFDRDLPSPVWICVSPKPGYILDVVRYADEIKVIVPGLGSGPGWPTIREALEWTSFCDSVFLQPRNSKFDVDQNNLRLCQDIIAEHPELRLSVQFHKILKVQ